MDHRPFEGWLLGDERLTPEQDREMRIHLRNCPDCAGLERANLALRSAPVTAPAPGFALRFQTRLAAQRKVQRRRSLIGLFLLAIVGAGSLVWLLFPYLPFLSLSPVQLAGLWISNLVYIGLTVRALGTLCNSLLNILASMIPAYAWVLTMVMLSGMVFLWTFSFRRIGKFVKSAAGL
jgi:hypothetical protein